MATTTRLKGVCAGLLAVGALALAGCGTRGPSPAHGPATGVVTGRVTAGPTCPVERIDHPCPPTPVVAEVQARAGGRLVGSTRSAADGTYRLDLLDATYTVVAVAQNPFPRCTTRTVTVTGLRTVNGDISCDTGIR
jgi:hypothetical protein